MCHYNFINIVVKINFLANTKRRDYVGKDFERESCFFAFLNKFLKFLSFAGKRETETLGRFYKASLTHNKQILSS
jgi:hypothetical protein